MFWDAVHFFTLAYFMVAIITNTFGALQYYLDGGRQRTRQAVFATINYGWRGFRVHLITIIFLLLITVSVKSLLESDRSTRWERVDHYTESIVYAREVKWIGSFYSGELPSNYADAALMRHLLDQALVHTREVQTYGGVAQLSDHQSWTAYEQLFVGGLWNMYIGIIEADLDKYQLGDALLREWYVWLDDKEAIESDLLLGVSKSHYDLPPVGLKLATH